MTAARRTGPTLFPLRKDAAPGGADRFDIGGQMDAAQLPQYETEWRFDPDRRWRFDYAWPFFRIALEVEGGAHGRLIVIERGHERRGGRSIPIKAGTRVRVGGRHQSGPGMEADIEKYNRAAVLGWMVLRCTTRQIRDGLALAMVRDAFRARGLE